MNKLDNFFLKYSDKILFLTVKKININGKSIENIDLPIYHNNLIHNIQNNNFSEEVSVDNFVEGIVLLNGINCKYKGIDLLNDLLKYWKINLEMFLNKYLKYDLLELEDLVYNLLILKGVENIQGLNFKHKSLYCKLLLDLLEYLDIETQNFVINTIKINLNELLKIEQDNAYLHLLYGDVYVYEKFYIKGKISYEIALKNSQNEKISYILRKRLEDIYVKSELEQIMIDLKNFKFDKVYTILNTLCSRNLDSEDLYWIGFSYSKLSDLNEAIKYYEKALKKNANYLNLFLDLGICYYKNNNIENALRIYEKGLKYYEDDENLMFNKILIDLKLGNLKKAKESIDKLLLYEDLNIHIMNDILYLNNLYNL